MYPAAILSVLTMITRRCRDGMEDEMRQLKGTFSPLYFKFERSCFFYEKRDTEMVESLLLLKSGDVFVLKIGFRILTFSFTTHEENQKFGRKSFERKSVCDFLSNSTESCVRWIKGHPVASTTIKRDFEELRENRNSSERSDEIWRWDRGVNEKWNWRRRVKRSDGNEEREWRRAKESRTRTV